MNRDIISYAVILAGSILFLCLSLKIPRTDVTLVNSASFPMLVLGITAVLSALGLFKAVRAGGGVAALKPIQTPLWIMLGIVAAFIILLNLAGFIIAAGLFIAVFSVYMAGDNRPVYIARMLAVGFAISFAVNYIFTEILSYILP